VLTGCETIKKVRPSIAFNKETVPTVPEQFECGPAVEKLPSGEIVKEWPSARLLEYAIDSWLWGESCAVSNRLNKHYFACAKGDKKECETFKTFTEEVRERRQSKDK